MFEGRIEKLEQKLNGNNGFVNNLMSQLHQARNDAVEVSETLVDEISKLKTMNADANKTIKFVSRILD